MSKTLTAGDVARNPSLYDGSNGKGVRLLQVPGQIAAWARAVLLDEASVRLSGDGGECVVAAETPIAIKQSV